MIKAYLPASGVEGFSSAANGDGPFPHARECGDLHVLTAGVDEPLINLIAHTEHVVTSTHVCYHLQLGLREHLRKGGREGGGRGT